MLIRDIIQAIHPLQVIGNTDNLQNLDIRHLLTDSRQLGAEPEATLFFALKTDKNDGAKYIPQLIERGVKVFVVGVQTLESGILLPKGELKETLFLVDDSMFLDIRSHTPRASTKYVAAWRYLNGKEYY